jgi:hypothetical protein
MNYIHLYIVLGLYILYDLNKPKEKKYYIDTFIHKPSYYYTKQNHKDKLEIKAEMSDYHIVNSDE